MAKADEDPLADAVCGFGGVFHVMAITGLGNDSTTTYFAIGRQLKRMCHGQTHRALRVTQNGSTSAL